jgi:hypothetical protein
MTIEKGQPWGTEGFAPHDLMLARDEEAAARAVSHGTRHVALQHGELLSALGLGGNKQVLRVGDSCRLLPFDAYEVTVWRRGWSESTIAVSTVLIGTWRQPTWWFTAGGFVGSLNAAPNSHPNDGRADALEWSRVSVRDMLAIRRRMHLGDHLPHPALHTARGSTINWQSTHGTRPVTIDGRRWGRADHVSITVRPDAFVLCTPN